VAGSLSPVDRIVSWLVRSRSQFRAMLALETDKERG
jgi:hypothetical protein